MCPVGLHRADCETGEVGVDFCTTGGRLSDVPDQSWNGPPVRGHMLRKS